MIIGADGALSTVARLAGMLDSAAALWGFAVRAYVPGEVPLPLLVLLESAPWRIYPGYGWLFPGADGQANVGIGIGMGGTRHSAPLREDLDRFTALLRSRGDLRPAAEPGPVIGGWLRMGGTGTPAAAGNVLLVGDAAGLINPLQGEGIAPAMISARLAAEAVLADPCRAGPAYAPRWTRRSGTTCPAPARCSAHCCAGRGRRPPACAWSPPRSSAAWWPAPGRSTGTAWPTGPRPAPPHGPPGAWKATATRLAQRAGSPGEPLHRAVSLGRPGSCAAWNRAAGSRTCSAACPG